MTREQFETCLAANPAYAHALNEGQRQHREEACREAERDGDREAVRLHALRLAELAARRVA